MRFVLYLFIIAIIAKIVWNDGSLLNKLLLFSSIIIWIVSALKSFIDPDFWSVFIAVILPFGIIAIEFIKDFFEYWPPISKARHIKMNDKYVKRGSKPLEWDDLSIEEYQEIVKRREDKKRKRFWYYWF